MTGWEHSAVSEEKHRVFSRGLLCVVGACQHSAVSQQEHQLFTVCATLPPVGPCIPNTFYLHCTLPCQGGLMNQSLNSKSCGWYYEQWNGWQGILEFILRGEGAKKLNTVSLALLGSFWRLFSNIFSKNAQFEYVSDFCGAGWHKVRELTNRVHR